MFSIDFPEIIIIFGVALVVLGPKRLPGAAAKIGRWVGRARSMARQFREQLEQEVSSVENAIDIRKSVDSVAEPARRETAQSGAAGAEAAPPESVPHDAVAHGTPAPDASHEADQREADAHEPLPDAPTPYASMPYGPMPPPEGYEQAPQQLTFDAQLHDTALPPEDPEPMRDWMPETQTWMASAGWETPEPPADETAGSQAGAAPGAPASQGSRSAPHQAEADSAAPKPSSRAEAVEHDDR
ncbi:MAG: Sec-independent protein translocase protein TatB [Steroidobacteraceae bacterium]